MSTAKLLVRMGFIEGALNRLLGLTARRGFDINTVDARRSSDDASLYEITMELGSVRPFETLARQIEKLYDVRSVEILPVVAMPLHIAGEAAPSTFEPLSQEITRHVAV